MSSKIRKTILQQHIPVNYVIATGETNTLENFVATSFCELDLNWKDHVELNEEFMRPTDFLISVNDSSKAKQKLNWRSQYKMAHVIRMMTR